MPSSLHLWKKKILKTQGTVLIASFLFLTLDTDTATAALNLVNGYLFKGKPVIIQYGKQRKDSSDKNSKNVNTHGASSA